MYLAIPIAALAAVAFSQSPEHIERLNAKINQIVAANVQIERPARGADFKWTEGPIWIHTGYLLFAEIPSNSIRKWVPGGSLSVFMQPSGYKGSTSFAGPESGSNGMTLDGRGRL